MLIPIEVFTSADDVKLLTWTLASGETKRANTSGEVRLWRLLFPQAASRTWLAEKLADDPATKGDPPGRLQIYDVQADLSVTNPSAVRIPIDYPSVKGEVMLAPNGVAHLPRRRIARPRRAQGRQGAQPPGRDRADLARVADGRKYRAQLRRHRTVKTAGQIKVTELGNARSRSTGSARRRSAPPSRRRRRRTSAGARRQARSDHPDQPRLLRGGLVVLDPDSGAVQRVITLQYNPDSLSRAFQLKASGGDGAAPQRGDAAHRAAGADDHGGGRARRHRPARVPAEQCRDRGARDWPPSWPPSRRWSTRRRRQCRTPRALMAAGMLEIVAAPAPLVLFAFGRRRLLPVKLTELSIVEEAFDPMLNPIRAKVRLGLRVLTVNDVGPTGRAGSYAMAAHRQLEQLAGRARGGRLTDLGIDRV